MRKDAWVEYGSPGTTILSRKDIERAIGRLERSWGRGVILEQLCLPRPPRPRVHLAKSSISPA